MYDSAVAQELAERILDALRRVTEELQNGYSVKDYSEYKYKIGQIDALKSVLESITDAETVVITR